MSFEDLIKTTIPNLNVSRETSTKFKTYQKLIIEWNHAFSLVQEKTLEDFAIRHLIDSLQIIKYLPNNKLKIIDIGTGAGFPGMVLAMYGFHNVTLVESNKKKTIFLNELARITDTNVCIYNDRAETISEKFNFVVSRACSSLTNLLLLMKNVSRETTQGIFHKGENHMQEIKEALNRWSFTYELHPSVTESNSKIIIIKNLEPK